MSKMIVTVLGIVAVLMVAAVFVTANAADDMSEKSYGGCGSGSCAAASGDVVYAGCGAKAAGCTGAGSCGGGCEKAGECGSEGCGCGK